LVIKQSLKYIAKWLFILATIAFFAHYLYDSISNLPENKWEFNPVLFSLSVVLLLLAMAASALIYKLIFDTIAGNLITFPKMFKIVSLSNLGRYLPGKLWSVLGFYYFTDEFGISKKQTTLGIIISEVSSKTSALLIGLCYFFFSTSYRNLIPLMVILLALCFILIYPRIIQWIVNILFRILRRPPVEIEFSYLSILKFNFYCIFVWLLYSLAFYAFVNSITTLSNVSLLKFATILPFCWVVGYIILIAPGGLGVREAMLIVMLGEFLPHELAVIIAVFQRVWFTLVEGITILISLAIPTKTKFFGRPKQ
jgi:glycosyltransferase 2 family protein